RPSFENNGLIMRRSAVRKRKTWLLVAGDWLLATSPSSRALATSNQQLRLGDFLADIRLPGGDRHHDADADGDEGSNADPDRRDALEQTGLPQGEAAGEHQNEVSDEKHVDEFHRGPYFFTALPTRSIAAPTFFCAVPTADSILPAISSAWPSAFKSSSLV